jgi:hypothetical protein
MRAAHIRHICAAVLLTVILAPTVAAQGIQTGVVTEPTPVFLFPDPNRQPLTTLEKATTVEVLERSGTWYRIRFSDRRFGERYGYIAADRVRLEAVTRPPAQVPKPPAGVGAPPTGQRPAPTARRRPRRQPPVISLSLNGGLQTTSRAFSAASTFDRSGETGALRSEYSSDEPFAIDAGLHSVAADGLTASVAVTYTSKPFGGAVTADVPHPFFFDRPRTVNGASPSVRRRELALHFDAGWTVALSRSTRVAVVAGPSYFWVTQGLVTELSVSEAYPYDTAAFLSVSTREASLHRWGYHGGVDLSQRMWRSVGVGFIARYSRASFKFPIVEGQNATVHAGGLQLGGGVRLTF